MTGTQQRILVLVAPAILVIVASFQHIRVRTEELTAWKGGGFGMFATIDSRGMRRLHCVLVTDGEEYRVDIPRRLKERGRRIRSTPTMKKMQTLADELAALNWIRVKPPPEVPEGNRESSRPAIVGFVDGHPAPSLGDEAVPVNARSVRLELWRYSFDSHRSIVTGALAATAEAPVATGGGGDANHGD